MRSFSFWRRDQSQHHRMPGFRVFQWLHFSSSISRSGNIETTGRELLLSLRCQPCISNLKLETEMDEVLFSLHITKEMSHSSHYIHVKTLISSHCTACIACVTSEPQTICMGARDGNSVRTRQVESNLSFFLLLPQKVLNPTVIHCSKEVWTAIHRNCKKILFLIPRKRLFWPVTLPVITTF